MNCIQSGTFLEMWKKPNFIPVYKNREKQYINNYRTVSLLPIFGKTFERKMFNQVFNFLEENKLLTPSQSGFRSNDFCQNQLLSIANNIYGDFDNNPSLEVRGSVLDISKAFGRVWHEGLLYKLETLKISG